jgi:hypothetical protein
LDFTEQAGRYAEYKLAPGAGLGYEVVRGKDIFGRPVPWGRNIAGNEVEETQFAPRYTYPEYALSHTPIFFNEGVREFYAGLRDHGINPSDATSIAKGVVSNPKIVTDALVQSAAGFVGIGIHRDYDLEKE